MAPESRLETRNGPTLVCRPVALLRAHPVNRSGRVRGRAHEQHVVLLCQSLELLVVAVGVVTVHVDDGGRLAKDACLELELEVGHLEVVGDPARLGLTDVDAVTLVEELPVEGAGCLILLALDDNQEDEALAVGEADDDGDVRRDLEGHEHEVAHVLKHNDDALSDRAQVRHGLVPIARVPRSELEVVLLLDFEQGVTRLDRERLQRRVVLVDVALHRELARILLHKVDPVLRGTANEGSDQRFDVRELGVRLARLADKAAELDRSFADELLQLLLEEGHLGLGRLSDLDHDPQLCSPAEHCASSFDTAGLGQRVPPPLVPLDKPAWSALRALRSAPRAHGAIGHLVLGRVFADDGKGELVPWVADARAELTNVLPIVPAAVGRLGLDDELLAALRGCEHLALLGARRSQARRRGALRRICSECRRRLRCGRHEGRGCGHRDRRSARPARTLRFCSLELPDTSLQRTQLLVLARPRLFVRARALVRTRASRVP
mmetsp:Transcript_4957/g.12320  ORF Transcript_4957/g.12320 Transcript_4957/m.12320 type:complete len:493 (-) Transcript_4957:212-1690(-)